MSEADETEVSGPDSPTVTPAYFGRPDAEMDVIGIAIGVILLVVVAPLLPFVAIIWVLSKIAGAVNPT
ncbi:MAG: hypothetical protein ABEJ31_11845 [Haloarculaceae archaeon]